MTEDRPVHADGWIDDDDAVGNRLFVNRGIGMSVVPVRRYCTPAITTSRLREEG